MRALIPAAGRGLRRLPATKAQPKELLPVLDRPAIEYVVEEAAASGIEEIFIVVGPSKRAIRDHFSRPSDGAFGRPPPSRLRPTLDLIDSVRIRYLVQRTPRGLGHAVYLARRVLGREPFAVLLGDDIVRGHPPCTQELIRAHETTGRTVVAVERRPARDLSKYGVVDPVHQRGRLWPVRGLVEKPAPGKAPSRYAVLGRYVLTPDVFQILRKTPPGRNGEIQLTDALHALARRGRVAAQRIRGRRMDIGGTVDWILANVELGLRVPEYRRPLLDGLRPLAR